MRNVVWGRQAVLRVPLTVDELYDKRTRNEQFHYRLPLPGDVGWQDTRVVSAVL